MTVPDLVTHLRSSLLALAPTSALVVGFSGGMDSTVLLHALSHDPQLRARGVRAVHIDHGLHADSARWARHCEEVAAAWDVALQVVRVEVAPSRGGGLEDAARRARLAAFARSLGPDEVVVLAQHRNDQAETVLLKLLRGAGPEGLGGIRSLSRFAAVRLWRPLLDLSRSVLQAYAQAHALRWIDDPSNASVHLSRNFLRHEILPRLAQRWPNAEATLAQSAAWARAAADFIDGEARRALARVQGLDPATLAWRPWLDLPDALRDPVLRLWLRSVHRDEPAHFHVAELERQLRDAGEDRSPCIAFAATQIRRYRDLLYAQAPAIAPSEAWHAAWGGEPLALPDGGRLELAPHRHIEPALQVRYRRGGERLRPAGGRYTRELRLLLQEAGLPPWQRAAIPLLWQDGELIAVADLYLSATAQALCDRLRTRIVWSPPGASGIRD